MQKQDFKPGGTHSKEHPIPENWLFCTKNKPTSVKPEEVFKVSEQTPD